MTSDASGGGKHRSAYLRPEKEVRLELSAASYKVWIGLIDLLAQRWDDAAIARQIASDRVRVMSDLAKLRCLPDGQPLPANDVFVELRADVTRDGKTPESVVERYVARSLAGRPRSARSTAEITALIEAFLHCYSVDCERGELTWVDELYAMAVPGDAAATWTVEVPPGEAWGEDAMVVLRVPAAALEAAYLRKGDRLIVEPRSFGLWLGRAPQP